MKPPRPRGERKLLGLGLVALAYVAVDVAREHLSSSAWLQIPPSIAELIQPGLWGSLAICALFETPHYAHWGLEIRAFPKFLACLVFMVGAIMTEVVMVQFVTAVLGLDWHKSARPLPDTGQWILLALNERLPRPIVSLLRAPLIELHHYLMLFILLAFSVLFNCVKPPGFGLGARYCFAMGVGRILRFITFTATILPSARPWCAEVRFGGSVPNFPHPWAQKYYVPYSANPDLIARLLEMDSCYANLPKYPEEFVPKWGALQFLVNFLRPMDPAHRAEGNEQSFMIRPGGGCNDLAYSGHVLVAVLTACAWQEAFPGWTSRIIWALVLHSGQREIRERHHYSLDVVAGIYVGILLWRSTAFLWTAKDASNNRVSLYLSEHFDDLLKGAKEGDLERVRALVEKARNELKTEEENEVKGNFVWIFGVFLTFVALVVTLVAFRMNVGG